MYSSYYSDITKNLINIILKASEMKTYSVIHTIDMLIDYLTHHAWYLRVIFGFLLCN